MLFRSEVVRSCPELCRFCLASYLTLPFRTASLDDGLIPAVETGLAVTRRLGLLGASVVVLIYKGDAPSSRAEREAAELLWLSRESNAFFVRYFEHVFPFDKQDLVLLPEFPYGGMEHAGAVFLREEIGRAHV